MVTLTAWWGASSTTRMWMDVAEKEGAAQGWDLCLLHGQLCRPATSSLLSNPLLLKQLIFFPIPPNKMIV